MKKEIEQKQKVLESKENNFAVPKKNVAWILLGFGIMVLGFILLAGGGSSDPDVFSPAIFSARRLVVAPIVIVVGIIVIIAAIMRKGKEKED